MHRGGGGAENGTVSVALSIVRRTLLVPSLWPVAFVSAVAAWVGTWLAVESMGATEVYVAEVRHGSMLFAGVLTLSLAEPLQTARDARSGLLLLRVARGGGFALVSRWLGLVVATLPLVLLAGLAAGGLPAEPLTLLVQLLVISAAGLALGAFLERGRLVPALWGLVLLGHLQPWIASARWGGAVAWLLPRLGQLEGGWGLVHGLAWSAGALLVAQGRLSARHAEG